MWVEPMNRGAYRLSHWIIGLFYILLSVSISHAAKPDRSSASASTDPAEIYWLDLDYANRTLSINGINLITGSLSNPEFPEVSIGGVPVVIDEAASAGATDFNSNEGPLIITFDNVLGALIDIVEATSEGSELPGKINFAVKIVASSNTLRSSIYIYQAIRESTAPPPPPPSTGTCPCSADYDKYYDELYALLWPTCTAPGSSNPPLTGTIAVERYIDAQFINELEFKTISIGSDSSTSPRSSLAGTCHVRKGDYWPLSEQNGMFVEPPIPVSDEDHMACVASIIAREAICRGGNWMDP
jgi:hypothetical protein